MIFFVANSQILRPAGVCMSEGKLFSSCFTSLDYKLAVVEGASFRLANNTEVTLGETESTKKKDEKIERTTETESNKKN